MSVKMKHFSKHNKYINDRFKLHQTLREKGGAHLGAVRRWIQNNIIRGDSVIWGSDEQVTVTIKQLEDIAHTVAADAIMEDRKNR